MRKVTHFKKVVSLALAAAMAVSVCTTALAEETVVDADTQPAASETVDAPAKSAEEVTNEDTDADVDQSEENAPVEEEAPVEENTPAQQNAPVENAPAVQAVAEQAEETLQSKIDAAESGATITLDKDYTESIVIASNDHLTINLNGHTLTNTDGQHTITNHGYLIIAQGNGTVDNTSHGKAAVYNDVGATVFLNGGTFTRSAEKGASPSDNGGNSYYTIKNYGEMTVNGGVVVENKGHYSSLFASGWYSYGAANEPTPIAGKTAKLTINGGTFDGGLNTIKNDDNGELIINEGTFKNYTQACFQNHNIATVSGGSFEGNAPYAIDNCGCAAGIDTGKLTITGGRFVGAISSHEQYSDVTIENGEFLGSVVKTGGKMAITGGTFSKEPADECIAEDYEAVQDGSGWKVQKMGAVAQIGDTTYTSLAKAVAAANVGDTITLLTDVEEQVVVKKDVTLNLGGHTLSKSGSYVLDIYSNVTITNGTVLMNGTRDREGGAIWVNGTANLTIESDATVIAQTSPKESYALNYDSSCTAAVITVKGKVQGQNGISINGEIKNQEQNKLVLDGANINVTGHGIYQAGDATTVTLSNSTITGATGIEVRAGDLEISNSTITATGSFECVGNEGGPTTIGAAVAIAQHTTGQAIDVKISGGTLTGAYALYEANPQKKSEADIAQVKISVTGGKFSGLVYSEDIEAFVTGGYYTNEVDSKYIGTDSNNKQLYCNLLTEKVDGIYNYEIGPAPEVEVAVVPPKTETKDMTANPSVTGKTDEAVKAEVNDVAKNIKIEDNSTGDVAQKVFAEATVDGKKLNDKETAEKATANLEKDKIPMDENTTVTIVAVPKLDIQPVTATSVGTEKALGFEIELKYDVYATTVENPTAADLVTKEDAESDPQKTANAVLLSKDQIVDKPPVMDITIPDVSIIGITEDETAQMFVKHVKEDGSVYFHDVKDVTYKNVNGEKVVESVTFQNDKGFSTFTVTVDPRTTTIKFDKPANAADESKKYIPSNVSDALPAAEAKSGYRFLGWRINGKVYTTLTDGLLDSTAADAFAVYEQIPVDAASGGNAATTTAPAATAAPEATAAPSASGTEVYYTCVACGHHDWTATAEGYKCNYCGHLESVKQLSGYANVKGTYEPKTSTAKAAAAGKSTVKTSSAIPQTSDDMPIVPIAVIAIAALLGLGVTVVLKRKHN